MDVRTFGVFFLFFFLTGVNNGSRRSLYRCCFPSRKLRTRKKTIWNGVPGNGVATVRNVLVSVRSVNLGVSFRKRHAEIRLVSEFRPLCAQAFVGHYYWHMLKLGYFQKLPD